MENEEIVAEETLETPEETTEETVQETEVETQDEKDLKIAELEEKNRKLFERAKKAEGKKAEKPDLSTSDIYALMNAKVPEEDISEVSDYAKLKSISIAEALKSSVVRTILAERIEERATADATSTGAQRRAPVKVSDDVVLNSASKGQLPEDDAGIERLTEARMNAKLKS